MGGRRNAATLNAIARDVRYEVDRLFQAADLYPKASEAQGQRLLFEARFEPDFWVDDLRELVGDRALAGFGIVEAT